MGKDGKWTCRACCMTGMICATFSDEMCFDQKSLYTLQLLHLHIMTAHFNILTYNIHTKTRLRLKQSTQQGIIMIYKMGNLLPIARRTRTNPP